MDNFINKIICGDCVKILRSMTDSSIELIFADPPYNNGMKYAFYDDNKSLQEYKDWCREWFLECRRVSNKVIITPGHGNIWMWGEIEKPFGIGSWFKPGNPASSVLGWCCWEPWMYYSNDRKILGGPDSFRIPVTKQKDTGDHPCPKPLALLMKLIEKTTQKNDIVLDPFVGSGTTCLAAKLLERSYIGIDIDKSYVDHTIRRLDSSIDIFD